MQYIRTQIAKDLGLYANGFEPATPGSAGVDLHNCSGSRIVIAGACDQVVKVPTGLHVWARDATRLIMLAPRSSSEFRIVNTIGVVDSDYQGELIVKICNPWYEKEIVIEPGEAFAQMIQFVIVPAYAMRAQEVDEFEYPTRRGKGGFGSTGK